MAVMVLGERYEVVRARVDLVEAASEYTAAATASEREIALQRAEDAKCRILRWRDGDDDC